MAKTKSEETIVINVPKINLKSVIVTVEGTSSLIMHKWSEKAKKEMLGAQINVNVKVKAVRKPRNPVQDFIDSMYWITPPPTEYTEESYLEALKDAKFGFPSVAFKKAATSAGYRAKITKDKVSIYGAFYIEGELVEIKGKPIMREDMVRLNGLSADLRYRGEFTDWSATMTIVYNADVISAEELVNLLNYGGFACGVGEWRPEKSGQFGMYQVKLG
jgi:hypothetical protein